MITGIMMRVPVDTCSNAVFLIERRINRASLVHHHLLNQTAAEVGERQQEGAGEAEPDDAAAAPALMIMAPQQHDIHEPAMIDSTALCTFSLLNRLSI